MGTGEGSTSTAQQVADDFRESMLMRLRDMNEVVGKTTLDEVYSMTPKELDYTLAGGYQRSYDRLQDLMFALSNTIVPTAFIDPAKFDFGQADENLKERREAVLSLTDKKVKAEREKKQKQQQRFIDLLM